ncbi:MAG: hypothetical protein JW827_08920 [Spirochaetes bacterium]|nr:hypothetical protein [Spirochaetota bacterium]
MLKELKYISQIPDQGFRKWFEDDFFDLVVWYHSKQSSNTIEGFQLCYDKPNNEHAFTWFRKHGYMHNRIDDGEIVGSYKMTPVLVSDGVVPIKKIIAEFDKRSQNMDKKVRQLVMKKLKEFSKY